MKRYLLSHKSKLVVPAIVAKSEAVTTSRLFSSTIPVHSKYPATQANMSTDTIALFRFIFPSFLVNPPMEAREFLLLKIHLYFIIIYRKLQIGWV